MYKDIGGMVEFSITRLVKWSEQGALKPFCDVAVDGHLVIKGIRVVQGRHGLFVSMPRQQDKQARWHDVVILMSQEAKQELSRVILEAFQQQTACEAMVMMPER